MEEEKLEKMKDLKQMSMIEAAIKLLKRQKCAPKCAPPG